MIVVQTFWPGFNKDKIQILNSSSGWMSPLFNYMSWGLSVLQLKNYYKDIILHTNSSGAEVLIDILGLPYSKVVLSHDQQPYFQPQLWAMSKIRTYEVQSKPFLHVDADVYTWKIFFANDNKALYAQNLENNFQYNINAINIAKSLKLRLPKYIPAAVQPLAINSVNAGVFGGNDINFINRYAHEALDFYLANHNELEAKNDVDLSSLNSLIEQVFFFYLAESSGKEIQYLLGNNIKSQYYKGFVDFEKIPLETTFIHALGSYKRNRVVCRQLAAALEKYHPKFFTKLVNLFPEDHRFWILADPMEKIYNVPMKTCI
jgi:hypothetical protein